MPRLAVLQAQEGLLVVLKQIAHLCNLHQPVYEDRAHGVVQFRLEPLHVGGGWPLTFLHTPPCSDKALTDGLHLDWYADCTTLYLCLEQVVEDLWCIGSAGQRVCRSLSIDVFDVLKASDTPISS